MRRGVVVLLAGVVTALTLLLLVGGHGPSSGVVIWSFSPDHGLHTGDLPALLAWVIGIAGCAWLWRKAGSR